MKKKLVSIMALSLCLSMGMGVMASCFNNEDPNSGSSPVSTPTPDPLTDDEILAKVGAAYLASMAYDGAFTVNMSTTNKDLSSSEEDSYVYATTMYASLDPATNRIYQEQISENYSMVAKIFKNGDTYYSYMKDIYNEEESEEPKVEEMYKALSNEYVVYQTKDTAIASLFDGDMFMEIEPILNIESVAEFNDALETIMADRLAALPEGTTGSGEMKIVCTENADSCVVEIIMGTQMTTTEEGVTQTHMNQTISFTEKDGKLAAFAVNMETIMEMTMDAEEGGEPVTQKSGYSQETSFEFTYTFDQAKYDSVEVTPPEGLEIEEDYSRDFKVVINGIENEDAANGYGETVQEAMEQACWDAMSDLGNADGLDVVWYKDEACTEAINLETLTAAEYYAIDTLYGKATLKDGYAFLIAEETVVAADDLPEAYKIFFNLIFSGSNEKYLYVVEAGEVYFEGDEDATIYLNGTPATEESFMAESGQTYNVEYREIADKDYFM